ncbi:hypothetical protein RJ43_10875 [Alteromonas macleodii]|nr:hypothetical protein RJ43_10875 [Alteromonas macleodii]
MLAFFRFWGSDFVLNLFSPLFNNVLLISTCLVSVEKRAFSSFTLGFHAQRTKEYGGFYMLNFEHKKAEPKLCLYSQLSTKYYYFFSTRP